MKKLLAFLLACMMLMAALTGCSKSGGNNEGSDGGNQQVGGVTLDGSWPEETVKIGVVIFDSSDESWLQVKNYLDYLTESFNVEFIYSESLSAAEEEFAFIDSCASAGCQGIFAYYNIAGAESMKAATSRNMYYWGTSDYYDEMEGDPYYVGAYSLVDPEDPDAKNADYLAGYELAYAIAEAGMTKPVFCNGGASFGVQMFIDRQQGFFDGIAAAQAEGYEIEFDQAEDVIEGWPGTDDFAAAQSSALAADYDAVASSFDGAMWFQPIMESGKDVKVACVGTVSDTYKTFIENGTLIALVYECPELMFGSGFANLMNAATGHVELAQNDDGSALLNYVQRWVITDAETFDTVYNFRNDGGFYVTAEDMANILGALNPEATVDDVVATFNMSAQEALG